LEIGSGSAIPEAGVQHADRPAVEAAEFVATQPLVPPDLLEPTFWQPVRSVGHGRRRSGGSRPPAEVEIGRQLGHDAKWFPGFAGERQAGSAGRARCVGIISMGAPCPDRAVAADVSPWAWCPARQDCHRLTSAATAGAPAAGSATVKRCVRPMRGSFPESGADDRQRLR